MNFIERYFGMRGGDGLMEIMVLVLLVVFGTLIGMLLPIARAPKKESSQERK